MGKLKEREVKHLSEETLILWLNAQPGISVTKVNCSGEEMISLLRIKEKRVFGEDIDKNIRTLLGIRPPIAEPETLLNAEEKMGRLEELSTSFKSEFVNNGALEELVDMILKTPSSSEPIPLFPYIPIFQSSGYGKSKLIFELAKEKMFTIYWCLRNANSSGFPVQSSFIVDNLEFLVRNLFARSSSPLLSSPLNILFVTSMKIPDRSSLSLNHRHNSWSSEIPLGFWNCFRC